MAAAVVVDLAKMPLAAQQYQTAAAAVAACSVPAELQVQTVAGAADRIVHQVPLQLGALVEMAD